MKQIFNNFIQNLSYLLKTADLRNFFAGKFLADFSKWMQLTAVPWLVYARTNSALLLGTVAFLEYIAVLFLPPVSGVIIKQYSRKKLVIFVNISFFVIFMCTSILYFFDLLRIWHLCVLAVVTGFLYSFDITVRQTLISDIVPKEKIINALGFNSLLSNLSRFFAPALAGVITHHFNEGYCFIVNSVSSLFAILFFCRINVSVIPEIKTECKNILKKYISDFKKAFVFLKSDKYIKYMLVLLAAAGFAVEAPVVLMPVFAKDIFNINPQEFGFLVSARGLGALFATFTLISKSDSDNLRKIASVSSFIIALLVLSFAYLYYYYIVFVVFALIGYFMVLNTGVINSYIQIVSSKEDKSVMIGFFVSCLLGFIPLSDICAGYLAYILNPRLACCIIGITAFSLIFFAVRKVK